MALGSFAGSSWIWSESFLSLYKTLGPYLEKTMGWLYTHKPSDVSAVDFLKSRFDSESDTAKYEVLSGKVINLKTAYLAIRRTNKVTGKSVVYAEVVLLGYSKKDYNNFGYKDMSEFSGPYYYDCPQSILDLLSPADDLKGEISDSSVQEAVMWREVCARQAERKRRLKELLQVGTVLEISGTGIPMSNGAHVRRMKVASVKPLRFESLEHGFMMKLSNSCLDDLVKRQGIWPVSV